MMHGARVFCLCYLFVLSLCINFPDSLQETYKIVLVRHGQSEWNLKNLYTGWYDAPLTEKGKSEALAAGQSLSSAGFRFDVAHTSLLTRAQQTLNIILNELNQTNIPIKSTWRLNERHYGNLTGLNKAETVKQYTANQVFEWRRNYVSIPPKMEPTNPFYNVINNDVRYNGLLDPEDIPKVESIEMAFNRFLPYWNDVIIPQLKSGKRVIIASHSNILLGIVRYLEDISEDAFRELQMPTGRPFVYELDEHFKPIFPRKFLQ